jgi:nucleoside-diphosphate-sugar epimerase/predicted dehydrogenase
MQASRLPGKIVVLGAGAVVRECFLPALQLLGMLDRITVVDAGLTPEAVTARYREAQFVRSDYRSWLEGGRGTEYVAAVIALPNACHDDAVRLAFDRGLHVLCEKPLTLSSASCRELAEAAVRHNRVLAVNMVRRLYPSVALVRFALERGLIGNLQSIDIQHGSSYAWPAETLGPFRPENGGVLADMGVHYLDLAEYLVGELRPCEYDDDYRGGVEADLSFSLRSAGGADIRIGLSRLRTLRNDVVLTGTSGTLVFRVDDMEGCTLTVPGGLPIRLTMPKPFPAGDFPITFAACFAQQLDDFFAAVETGRGPLASGFDAARTASHIEWACSRRTTRAASSTGAPFSSEASPVLVTGATGFIGTHLIERLASNGPGEITAIVRGPRNCAGVARFPVQLRQVDLLDSAQVRASVKGQRHVFHLAYGRDGDRRRDTTVEGTRNIVNAAIEEGCESVVVLSTAYVFGWPDRTVDENDPYKPAGGEYGASKMEMEQWCLKAAATSGKTRIVVLNPTCVYGPWGPTYSKLPVTLAREGVFCWIDEGAGAANYTYIGNLVDAILLAAVTPEAHGQRFIINDGTTTWRSFLTPLLEPWISEVPSYSPAQLARLEAEARPGLFEAARLLGASPQVRDVIRKTSLGSSAIRLARRTGLVSRLKGQVTGAGPRTSPTGPARLPPPWLAELFPNHTTRFSSEKARRVLGWKPRTALPEGQLRTIDHLADIGLIPVDREEKVLAGSL